MSTAIAEHFWTEKEDTLLRDTALEYIRTGKKLQDAWLFIGETLGRTPGAVATRWNTFVASKNKSEIAKAREDRRELRKTLRKGGSKMTTIQLPKNRPIQPVKETAPVKMEEIPVTTGVQQEINFDNNEIVDSYVEKKVENPFLGIHNSILQLEKEYQSVVSENNKLRKESETLRNSLQEAKKELEYFAEIKELIVQFNKMSV